MTLVGAFRCTLMHGEKCVVICADTQETEDYMRSPVEKIALQDRGHYQLVVGGSGTHGILIDDFAESLGIAVAGWEAGLNEQACRIKVKRFLKDFHDNEVESFKVPEHEKQLDFIICLKGKQSPDIFLWRTDRTGFKTILDFDLIGIGAAFYKSQVKKLYRPDISMPQAFLLGSYILSQAKESFKDIGLESQFIGAVPSEIYEVTPDLVGDMEGRVADFNEALTQLVLSCPDVSLQPAEFESLLKNFEARIMELRAHYLGVAVGQLTSLADDPNFKGTRMPLVPPDTLVLRGVDGKGFIPSPEDQQAFFLGMANPLTPEDSELEPESPQSDSQTSEGRQSPCSEASQETDQTSSDG